MMASRSSRHNNSSSSNGSHEFFKFYLPNQSSKQLIIPSAFLKHLRGPLPMKYILEGPNGKAWAVKLKEVEDNVFIGKGWEIFVVDNCLEVGDLMMFSYNGLSTFGVKIFGRNGCEKIIPAAEVQQRGKRCDKYVKVEDIGEDSDIVVVEEDVEQTTNKLKGKTSDAIWKSQQLNVKENDDERSRMRAIWTRRSVGTMKYNVSVDAAKTFKSSHPHFAMVMRQSYVFKGPASVPIKFFREYMKEMLQMNSRIPRVELWVANNMWLVNLIICSSLNCKFSMGWLQFVQENCIQEGDVCVFELTDVDHMVFKVHIYRH